MDIRRRVLTHLRHLKQGNHENVYMQRVYNQYRQFDWQVLQPCMSAREAVGAEQALLTSLVGTDGCVNLNRSAVSGPGMMGRQHTEATKVMIREKRSHQTFSEETRQRLSLASLGNHRQKGHSISDETRRKISSARTGVVLSDAHRRALSLAKTGKTVLDKTREVLSKAQKAHWELVRQGQVVRGPRLNVSGPSKE
jgi:hypothetical protein